MQQDPSQAQPAQPGTVPPPPGAGGGNTAEALSQMGFDHLIHHFDFLGWIVFVVLCVMSVGSWYFIVANFLRNALTVRRKELGEEKPLPPKEFRALVKEKMALLKMDESFAGRYLNDGFSGGEKKRAEILQMAVLRPEIAVLDETDSGLDIDALRIVSEGVNALTGPDLGVLLITHYQRILNYIKPHFVHVLVDGRIVKSGGAELALELEKQGYDWIREDQAA